MSIHRLLSVLFLIICFLLINQITTTMPPELSSIFALVAGGCVGWFGSTYVSMAIFGEWD